MIIDFSVSNFRSIKEEVTFSMDTGAHVKKYSQNVLDYHGKKVLKSAVLFGGNGSGKTNVLMSLRHLQSIVSFDSKSVDSKLPYQPFIFDKEYNGKDSYFRIKFMIGEDVYEYEISHNRFQIAHEKLLINGKLYFDRKEKRIPDNFKESFDNIRPNKSILFHGQDINDETCKKVYLWFVENIVFIEDSKIEQFFDILKDEKIKEKFLNFLYFADTTIIDAEIIEQKFSKDFIELLKKNRIIFKLEEKALILKHRKDEPGLSWYSESTGTLKMISLALTILASNNDSKIIVFDEFDVFFHQSVIESLINLMNHPKSKNQYFLSSHQVSVMDCKLRRDQIWITDKNKHLATTITSIFDFEIRTDTKFSSQYLKDRFGGMPIIDFDRIESVLF